MKRQIYLAKKIVDLDELIPNSDADESVSIPHTELLMQLVF